MSIQKKALKGVVWSSIESFGSQIITLLVFITLARLLEPSAFGIVALCMAFISLMEVFQQFGFGGAIIQRDDLERGHLDTAFWSYVAMGALLTLIGILGSGLFADFYNDPQLESIIKWLSAIFLIFSLANVQVAIVKRNMAFKSLAMRTLLAKVVSGTVAVVMALNGYGVWSLVAQQLVFGLTKLVVLWTVSDWRPGFDVSYRHFKDLFSFGASLMASQWFSVLSKRMDDFLIGFFLGTTALGFYAVGYRLINLVTKLLAGTVQKVAFPLFSRMQGDHETLQKTFYAAIKLTSLIALPGFFGLIVLAPDLIPLLFGDKWSESAPVMQMLALMGILRALVGFNVAVIISQGKPFWKLAIQILEAVVMVGGFILVVPWGIVAVAGARVFAGVLITPVWFRFSQKLSGISAVQTIAQCKVSLAASVMMIASIFGLRQILPEGWGAIAELALLSFVGGLIYLAMLHLLAPTLFKEANALLKQLKSEKKKTKKEGKKRE